jgi:hypothetical protein
VTGLGIVNVYFEFLPEIIPDTKTKTNQNNIKKTKEIPGNL